MLGLAIMHRLEVCSQLVKCKNMSIKVNECLGQSQTALHSIVYASYTVRSITKVLMALACWHPRTSASLLNSSHPSCSYSPSPVLQRSCLQCKQPGNSRASRYTQAIVTVRAEQNQSQPGRGSSGQPRTYQPGWERQSNYDYPPPPSQSNRQPPSGPPPPPDNNNNGFGSDFTKALLAGVFILGIGTGVWFDSQVSLYPSNVASTEIIDRKTPNSEVCMASGYSSMVFDQRIFVSFSPFNVYVAQPEVKPGCVLRRSNVRVLESRKLVSNEEVQSCKRNMNTFAFVGDLEKSPEVSCVYHSEDAENAFLKDPKSARLGDGFRARPGFEPANSEPLAAAAGAAAAKAAS